MLSPGLPKVCGVFFLFQVMEIATTREFFTCGVPASILLMIVLGVLVLLARPLMGMPVLLD